MSSQFLIPKTLLPIFQPHLHRLLRETAPVAMVSANRLRNLYRMWRIVERQNIQGDIVEAGVARGGSAVFLGRLAEQSCLPRELWLYDAFEQGDAFDGGGSSCEDVCHTLFDQFNLDRSRVHVADGWFQDTVSKFPDRPIALFHLDARGYEGCKSCFDQLGPRIEPGGFLVVDNYGADEGTRQATDEWVHSIPRSLVKTPFGHTQCCFQLPRV